MSTNPQPTIFVLSIFPDLITTVLSSSILGRAQLHQKVRFESLDLRSFAPGRYKAVDDTPFGGDQGMLFRVDVLQNALEHLRSQGWSKNDLKVIYLSPRGLEFRQHQAWELAHWLVSEPSHQQLESGSGVCPSKKALVFVCGRYEGVDERFLQKWVDLELSLGDFILTGGELASLVVIDALVRLLPGVLGDERSAKEETFSNGLLEFPQYTRPREHGGEGVPAVLTEGHHKKIAEYKLRESLMLTFAFRPDLIRVHSGDGLPDWAKELLLRLQQKLD